MRISVVSFTEQGKSLADRFRERFSDREVTLFHKPDEGVSPWAGRQFSAGNALVFIGACGIAVRAVAPFVKDKLTDSPVLVMDEHGRYVIPLLSGHMGGANALAVLAAERLGAEAVMTTATDINGKFAVDVFAKENALTIGNREGIAAVSAKILQGETVTVAVEGDEAHTEGQAEDASRQLCRIPYRSAEKADILISTEKTEGFHGLLHLAPKRYILGIGCRKGKSGADIGRAAEAALERTGLGIQDIAAAASIDRKKDEEGIIEWTGKNRIPFFTFSEEELRSVAGEFHGSAFVKHTVGVDNVCERSALYAAGEGAKLILEKQAGDGVTVALAERKWKVRWQRTKKGQEINQKMKHEIYIVGIGPGREDMMTAQAARTLERCDVIVGYPVYLSLLGEHFQEKEMISTPMRREVERCRIAYEKAEEGKTVALVCSGDAGVYGLASLMYELSPDYPKCGLTVIPGVTAASGGAALLGAPLNHDFCVISLSDLLTPWERIEKRLRAAAEGDFAIALYNPASRKRKDHLKRACRILLETLPEDRPCGYVENIGREGTRLEVCTLAELKDREVNMFTTVFIGNTQTVMLNGKLVARRGYSL